jgi:hypothetical protein
VHRLVIEPPRIPFCVKKGMIYSPAHGDTAFTSGGYRCARRHKVADDCVLAAASAARPDVLGSDAAR